MSKMCALQVQRRVRNMEDRRLGSIAVKKVECGKVFVEFGSMYTSTEEKVLRDFGFSTIRDMYIRTEFAEVANDGTLLKCTTTNNNNNVPNENIKCENNGYENFVVYTENSFFTPNVLQAEGRYAIRARAESSHWKQSSAWSQWVNFTVPPFSECYGWRAASPGVHISNMYLVDNTNARVATKGSGHSISTLVGSPALPHNKVTYWGVTMHLSCKNGYGTFVGVAPYDINQQTKRNCEECGWYFDCFNSALYSGPPHYYKWPGVLCGPRKGAGKYVGNGDTVGVKMDTSTGELAFFVNGEWLEPGLSGIPLDKPLVPCTILEWEGDKAELTDASTAKTGNEKKGRRINKEERQMRYLVKILKITQII